MIEVYDIKDAEPKKLDITPELAISAYNTLIQFCRQQEISEDGICSRCILYNNCPAITDSVPEDWEEIHYPRMTSNTTIEYLKDDKVQLITYGRSEDAEKAFKEMKNNGIQKSRGLSGSDFRTGYAEHPLGRITAVT